MTIQVVFDGGSIAEFDTMAEASEFMDKLEVEGYSFTYRGEVLPGIEEWLDARTNVVMAFMRLQEGNNHEK